MTDLLTQLQSTLGDAYTIERELGGGGMSRVFVARDNALGRTVVIKVLPGEMAGQVSIDRFRREIALAAQLQHPHIVPLLAAGETQGLPYFTMPFIRGESLRSRLIKHGELPVNEAIRVLREVASALASAHHQGVVHRDIKPDNVLVSGDAAMVTDFGVSKAIDAATTQDGTNPQSGLTSLGMALGTPAYMSPEQATADPQVDHRADIYSFGVMAYELLSGSTPFGNRPTQRMLMAHVSETPEPLLRLRPNVPPALSALVMKCLEKRPADRPQSADEILVALDQLNTPSGGSAPVDAHNQSIFAGKRLAYIVAAAAVAGIAIATVVRLRSPASPTSTATTSVAVLPLSTMGGDKSNDYFSEGMTEEITSALTKIPGLSVPPRSIAAAAAAKQSDVRAVGTALGVDAVLEGSVQRAGDRVRINVQLTKVSNGFQLWSDIYKGSLKDVFQVQDSIAKAIVAALSVRLASSTAPLVRTGTEDPVAHNLVLQGMYLWNRRSGLTLRQAIGLFSEAVRRDTNYARGYAGLALSYAVISDYINIDTRAATDSAMLFANRALALDSMLVEAYTAIGTAQARLWHNVAAEQAYRRAIQTDSTFGTARHWHALFLSHIGRGDEALAEMRRAQALEPASPIINTNVGMALYFARHNAEAESTLRRMVALDPTFSSAHSKLGAVLIEEKKFDEGIAEMVRGNELNGVKLVWNSAQLAHAYAVAGRTAEARVLLTEITASSARIVNGLAAIALVYSALGDKETALRWLKRAVDTYDPNLQVWSRDPRFDALRSDPRGAALFAKIEAMH